MTITLTNGIFDQLPEHLKNYWKKWGENVNEKTSVTLNETTYREISKLLMPERPYPTSIPPTAPQRLDQQVSGGERSAVTAWGISDLLMRQSLYQSSLQWPYGEKHVPRNSLQKPSAKVLGKRAVRDDVDDGPGFHPVQKRKARTCITCRRADCEGRWMGKACQFHPLSEPTI